MSAGLQLTEQAGAEVKTSGDVTWEEVEEAIRRLDGADYSGVLVEEIDEPRVHLGVAGGSRGRYVMFCSIGGESLRAVCSPDSIGEEELLSAGVPDYFASKYICKLDDVLRAARLFVDARGLSTEYEWVAH